MTTTKYDPTKEQWCWCERDSEWATGPFDSKEDALEAASNEIGEPDREVLIGRCQPFQPELYVHALADMSDVAERIESMATDNGWLVEDDLFDDKPGAEEALRLQLVAWAREYLTSTVWRMADDYTRETTYDVNAPTGESKHTTDLGFSDVVLRVLALHEVLRRLGFSNEHLFFEVAKNLRLADRTDGRLLSPFLLLRAQGRQFAINVDEQHGIDEFEGHALLAEMTAAAKAYNAALHPFDDTDLMNALIHTTLNEMGGTLSLMRALMDKGFDIPMVSSEYLATGREGRAAPATGGTMITKQAIARSIATLPDGSVLNHVLFEHGTVLFVKAPDEALALDVAKKLDAAVGPYGGEGGAPGDFLPMELKNYDGWLVQFCWGSAVMTIVLPVDLATPAAMSPTEVVQGLHAVGLCGRAARNKDFKECTIVARSWDATETS